MRDICHVPGNLKFNIISSSINRAVTKICQVYVVRKQRIGTAKKFFWLLFVFFFLFPLKVARGCVHSSQVKGYVKYPIEFLSVTS